MDLAELVGCASITSSFVRINSFYSGKAKTQSVYRPDEYIHKIENQEICATIFFHSADIETKCISH